MKDDGRSYGLKNNVERFSPNIDCSSEGDQGKHFLHVLELGRPPGT